MTDPENAAIEELLTGWSERLKAERKDDPLYQALAARPSMISRLRLANHEMMKVVLALNDVLKDEDGIEIDAEKYDLLKSLPKIEDDLAKHYSDTEGSGLSVDKAYQEIARQLRKDV